MVKPGRDSSPEEARRWRLWDDGVIGPAAEGLAGDSDMTARIAAGEWPAIARLWTTRQAIVVTERERRLPGFLRAAGRLHAQGWPVIVRTTGGSAFPTSPEVLNLSLAFRRSQSDSIDCTYRLLCEPIRDALAELGLAAKVGRGKGAFCEGTSDLLIEGSKVVGTAQCWKAGGVILAHAGILVAGDFRMASEAVNQFYIWSGGLERVNPGAVNSVAGSLGVSNESQTLLRRIRSSLRRSFSGQWESQISH